MSVTKYPKAVCVQEFTEVSLEGAESQYDLRYCTWYRLFQNRAPEKAIAYLV